MASKTRFSTKNNYKVHKNSFESNGYSLTNLKKLRFIYQINDDISYFEILEGFTENKNTVYSEGCRISIENRVVKRSGRRKPLKTYSIF